MKRLFAILLAIAMIFSMSITAFAEGEGGGEGTTPPERSITITNATIGVEYKVYKIFDATHANGDAVAYTISSENNPIFTYMFDKKDEKGNPVANPYLNYNPDTGAVTMKATTNPSDLVAYLSTMLDNVSCNPAAASTAASDTVQFILEDYGYYLIKAGQESAVTIDSNTPHAIVIDKTQSPASEIEKTVKLASEDAYGVGATAHIGDMVNYKITFDATNYSGDKKIKYYQINDTKGDAIWVDFNSVRVSITETTKAGTTVTTPLENGYFLNQSTASVPGSGKIGTWDGEMDNAQWYLVYLSDDSFRITIPWLDDHHISGTDGSYKMELLESNAHLYSSPATVTITYNAFIEENAVVGTTANNLFNRTSATWVCEHDFDSTTTDEVLVDTYGLGIIKDDDDNKINLPGAVFRIYSDEALTQPVYIIPTDIDGVYIVDSLSHDISSDKGAAAVTNSNNTLVPTRAKYSAKLADYLKESPKIIPEGDDSVNNRHDNYVVTPSNGKVIILGLKDTKYYLKETQAPAGYNALQGSTMLNLSENEKPFTIFVNSNGQVADLLDSQDGFNAKEYNIASTFIHNSKGKELPSTGGAGTVMMVTIGAILACGFAVLMITQKKMSIYKD